VQVFYSLLKNHVGEWFLDLQILSLAYNKAEIAVRVHSIIDKFAERGLRSLGVARQASALDAPCFIILVTTMFFFTT
jgi:hypothetical protein